MKRPNTKTAPSKENRAWLVGRAGATVHDLQFEGFIFAHTEWQPPADYASSLQAGIEVPSALLYYVKGSPTFNVEAEYTDIPKILRGYCKEVNGCCAQKPLKSCERIIQASSNPGDLVLDFFAHSGSTLLAAEMLRRRCYTMDLDPVYCEITIRRLERFRATGKTGWQNSNPFAAEIAADEELRALLQRHE